MIHVKKILWSMFPFLFLCIGPLFAVDDIAINGTHIKTQKKRLQEIQEELKQEKIEEKAVLKREESILGTLSSIERDLLRREKELMRLDSEYDQIQKKIISEQEKLNQIQHRIDQNQTRLHSRIVAIYKTVRIGYFPYLLSSNSYYDFMRMMKFMKITIDYDTNVLRNYQAQWLKKRHYQEKLENDITELKRIRAEQERKRSMILHVKKDKQAFLRVVRRQKAEQGKWIRELEDRAKELQLLIEKLERETSDKGAHDVNFKDHKGMLSLPVRGNIVSEKRGRGIIIEAPKDSPVRAVFSGRVIYSGWFEGYGNIVILDHGDKYYTVSGHASRVLKKVNDQVAEGEVIALVGDTGSIRGPRLYFEIRYKGKTQDPLEWLFIPKESYGPSATKKGSAAGGKGKT